jgi:hypothetical protein
VPLRRAAWADGLPHLIVSDGSEVDRYREGSPTLVGSVEGSAAVALDAGTSIVVETFFGSGSRSRLVRIRPGEDPERIATGNAPQVHLHDVAVIDGEHRILFSTYVGDENTAKTDTWGYLYVQDPDGSNRSRVTVSAGPEFGIGRVSFGGGVIVTSATADLTEVFEYFRPNGTQVKGRPNPTDDLPYAEPPYMSDAVLTPDGEWLAYLEGPDSSAQGPNEFVGSWVAVVLNQKTGRERLRVKSPIASYASRGSTSTDGGWCFRGRRRLVATPLSHCVVFPERSRCQFSRWIPNRSRSSWWSSPESSAWRRSWTRPPCRPAGADGP